MKVDFATFCHAGDAHRLHAPGQLKKQIESNNFDFNRIIVIYQNLIPDNFNLSINRPLLNRIFRYELYDIDDTLRHFGIDLEKSQYTSQTDKAHFWKVHIANHLRAIQSTRAGYIVFADNDCWMVRQPEGQSWIERGIKLLQDRPKLFIISPNDGEPERRTKRMSQQMFLARVNDFRCADFNQPGWSGNVDIPGGPMPEYWAMLEGRMELYCRHVGRWRYVLGPEYRYWHFNRLNEEGHFETDYEKY